MEWNPAPDSMEHLRRLCFEIHNYNTGSAAEGASMVWRSL